MTILIGADPEVFVKQAGVYRSAHGLVQGSKAEPYPVDGGAVQVDGMALEFNINPAESEDGFVYSIEHVMAQLEAMVPEYQVVADPVAHFEPEYMKAQPFEALELGCEPDYNAWTMDVNPKPDNTEPKRTAAGHVHSGWTCDAGGRRHLKMCGAYTRQQDFYVGLPSLLYDNNVERRSMYGKAGAFRPKPYGCEYRVLSNVWLRSPDLMRWVYRATQAAWSSLANGELADKYGDIQSIINESDVTEALKIIKAENLEVPHAVL